MRIDSSGNVGIGTASPTTRLDLSVPINSGLRVSDGTSSGVFYASGHATNSIVVGSTTNVPVAFFQNNTERMRIDTSGNVKIGTNATTYDYQTKNLVLADSSTAGISITNTTQTLTLTANSAGGYVGTRSNHNLQFTTNDAERMRITTGGEVYIAGTADQGAYNLQCNGTGVWGAGAYVNGSDARIKENVVSIDSGLDVVNKLNPVTYTYKKDWSKDQSTQTGFIAQALLVALEGKNYVDGIVQQGGEYMSVAYQNIIPLLTKAIQELSAKVETLEAQLQGK
jgi:hypothetical protein